MSKSNAKLMFTHYGHTPKRMLEEAACPAIGGVDGFAVGVEEVRELLGGSGNPKGLGDL